MKTTQVNEELSFKGEPIYLGIDVHKKQWTVSIMTAFKEHKTFVQPPEPAILSQYVRSNFPQGTYYSVYEAGFCGFWIDEALKREGIQNIVVNPADVPVSDKEKKQKYDHRDSRKLCKELRDGDLKGIYVPTVSQQQDRDLIRLRKKLVKDITRCKNRIKGLLNFYGIQVPEQYKSSHWPKTFIKWLEELELSYSSGTLTLQILLQELNSISELNKKLSRKILFLASDERYKKSVQLLRSIPGVGLIGSLTILTELGNIKRFKSLDHLCSYVGLVPNVYSSGDTTHVGSLTARRNIYLQPILIQCAWKAVSKDPALLKAYNDLCKRMKAQHAIIRIARKILNRIRFVLLNEQEYKLKTVSSPF
jgi:transposase